MSDVSTLAAPAELLGPAMHFVLTVAARRLRQGAPAKARRASAEQTPDLAEVATLWELAERYHPEQVWLAESWARGERSLSELARTAPRGSLSPAFLRAAGSLVRAASGGAPRPAPYVPEPTNVAWRAGAGA